MDAADGTGAIANVIARELRLAVSHCSPEAVEVTLTSPASWSRGLGADLGTASDPANNTIHGGVITAVKINDPVASCLVLTEPEPGNQATTARTPPGTTPSPC
jgi:hypothetical protein